MKTRLLLLLGLFGAAAIGSSCGSSDSAPPSTSPPVDEDAAVDASVEAAPDVQAEVGPPVRTVVTRDPWGVLDPANMLHDGDFELSGLDGMQYPWLMIEQSFVRTGAQCHSGLRCVELEPGAFIAGAFVWPDALYAEVSFWGKPTVSDCEQEAIGLVWQLDSQAEPIRVGALTKTPQDGWCQYGGTVEVDTSLHFYGLGIATRSKAAGDVVFDQATLRGTSTPPSNLRKREPLQGDDAVLAQRMWTRLREVVPPKPPREPKPVRNPTGRRSSIHVP